MADDDADDLLLQVEVVADGTEFIEFESGGQEVDHAYCYRTTCETESEAEEPVAALAGWAVVCVVLPPCSLALTSLL